MGKIEFEPGDIRFHDIRAFPDAELIPGVMILRITDSLFFANINHFREMVSRVERLGSFAAHPTDQSILSQPISTLIIDSRSLTEIDAQAMQILFEMLEDFKKRNISVGFVDMPHNIRHQLIMAACFDDEHSFSTLGPQSFFSSIPAAFAALQPNPSSAGSVQYSSYNFLSSQSTTHLHRLPKIGSYSTFSSKPVRSD